MEQILKIAKSREVLRNILKERDFDTETMPILSEYEIGKMIESNVSSDQSAELCNFSVPHIEFKEWKTKIIYYNFPPSMKNISKAPITKYIQEYYENNNKEDNIIFILPSNISTAVETYNGWIESINIELGKPDPDNKLYKDIVANNNYSMRHMTNVHIFNINSLCVNILDHELVPEHNVITNNAEIQEIMDKNYINNKSQFPIITKNDPISKILGIAPGDLVEIERPSLSGGISRVYRVCK